MIVIRISDQKLDDFDTIEFSDKFLSVGLIFAEESLILLEFLLGLFLPVVNFLNDLCRPMLIFLSFNNQLLSAYISLKNMLDSFFLYYNIVL